MPMTVDERAVQLYLSVASRLLDRFHFTLHRINPSLHISVVDYLILCTLRLTLKHKKTRCI